MTQGPAPTCSVDFDDACASICDTLVGCGKIPGTREECLAGCVARKVALSDECGAAMCESMACRSPLGCGGVSDPDECSDERHDVNSQCGEEVCTIASNSSSCELTCSSGPASTRSLLCEGTDCTCIEHGTHDVSCDVAASICDEADVAALLEIGATCCGW